MDYGWYDRRRLFLREGNKGKTFVEDQQLIKGYFIPNYIFEIAVHALDLNSSKGFPHLLKIDFIYFIGYYCYIFNKDGFSRNVELVCIFSDDVKFLCFCDVFSY